MERGRCTWVRRCVRRRTAVLLQFSGTRCLRKSRLDAPSRSPVGLTTQNSAKAEFSMAASFRASLSCGDNEDMLGEVRILEGLDTHFDTYQFHPPPLHACLQTLR